MFCFQPQLTDRRTDRHAVKNHRVLKPPVCLQVQWELMEGHRGFGFIHPPRLAFCWHQSGISTNKEEER